MRYVVTGAAGFIGSHLAQALLAARPRRASASTASRTTTTARCKEENAAGLDVLDARPRRGRPRRCSRRRRRLPPRRPAGRARELRRRLRALPDAATCSRRSACSRPPRGAASGSSSRRPRRSTATPSAIRRREDDAAAADLAVRDHEARVRAPRPRDARERRARRRRAPLLQRLRPAPAPGHGVHARCSRRSPTGGVPALRRRRRCRGASPTSPTSSRRRSRAMEHGGAGEIYNVGGGDEVDDERGDRARRAHRGPQRSTSSASRPCRGDVSAGRSADTAKASARTLGWAPTTGLEDGLRAQWDWAAARVAAP